MNDLYIQINRPALGEAIRPFRPIDRAALSYRGTELFLYSDHGVEMNDGSMSHFLASVQTAHHTPGRPQALPFSLPVGVSIAPKDIPRRIRRAVEIAGLHWSDAPHNELGTADERDAYADQWAGKGYGAQIKWIHFAPRHFDGIAIDKVHGRITLEDGNTPVGHIVLHEDVIADAADRYYAYQQPKRKVARAIRAAQRQVADLQAKAFQRTLDRMTVTTGSAPSA